MKVIKPTKKEVFDELRAFGCCWVGGQGCHCYSRQLRDCYEFAEKRLTRVEYTAEEIEEAKKHNAEGMAELYKMLDELWG